MLQKAGRAPPAKRVRYVPSMNSVTQCFAWLVMMASCPLVLAVEGEQPPRKETQVTLNAEYDTFSSSEGYGFVLIVSKWEPHGTAEVHMVGPRGDVLTIVSRERLLRANENGRITVFVPYELPGLYAGRWELVVAGKNGIHKAGIQVPAAPQERPDKVDGN
jgi:hypothetical protein